MLTRKDLKIKLMNMNCWVQYKMKHKRFDIDINCLTLVLFLFEFSKVAKFKEKGDDFSQTRELKIKNFPRRRKP